MKNPQQQAGPVSKPQGSKFFSMNTGFQPAKLPWPSTCQSVELKTPKFKKMFESEPEFFST